MPEYARVAAFDADEAALDALVNEIKSHDGPPEGVPAKRIIVLTDRATGRIQVVVRFANEEDLKKGNAALDAMSPPDIANMHRTSVESWEVVLERDAP
jgi:hypothetical protein